MVTAQYQAPDPRALSPNIGLILRFCRGWPGVAGISAVLRCHWALPGYSPPTWRPKGRFGSARLTKEGRSGLKLLERVLSGLRKLLRYFQFGLVV